MSNRESGPGQGQYRNDRSPAGDQSVSSDKAVAHLPKIISFETLVRCGNEIWIECNSQIYRLRKTRSGKLILTK